MRTPPASRLSAALRAGAAAVVGITGFSLAVVGGPSADAATTSLIWSAPVTYGATDRALDGDTIAVRVDGDGTDVAPPHVRNSGIQTMEVGQCHADAATAAMRTLTAGKRLRLSAINPASSSLGRPLRYIDVETPDGWFDPQLSQLQNGHALPLVNGGDSTRWRTYFTAAQQASRAGRHLWDTDACGQGPAQDTPLRIWANWDGNGDDTKNPNSEYVRILNQSSTVLAIGGWVVRTAGQDSYTFPPGARVPSRGTLTLRVGTGTNTTTLFHWGSPVAKFPNVNLAAGTGYGSGAYLFDPQGDLRAWSIYPCLDVCSDPLAGSVSLAVRADADGVDADNVNGEWVRLSPAGTSRIDLSYKVLSANGYTYEFPKGSVVEPGETVTVHVGQGYSSRLRQYWGNSGPVLVNGGGTVELRSPESVRVVCRQWGTGRC
jgi:endonuclease YncB( thermonuclease family)